MLVQQFIDIKNIIKARVTDPVDSPYKEPVTQKEFPCHDVVMKLSFDAGHFKFILQNFHAGI